jgi:hypothetical protein
MNDPLYRSEADPGSGKISLGVQPLEGAEQPVNIRHVEPGAIVPDEIGGLT